jgi:tRNA A-37 threonylcarbamoyl transferase component Bud32
MPEAVIHPTPQELNAFGLGKLPEHAAATVAAHLETCPDCRQVVADVLPDSFLGKLRAAKPEGSSFPPSVARPAIPNIPCPDVPPELASHPKYLVLRELGRGGMGVVYQARHKEMDRQVVIKVINRALLDRPDSLERFRREIRAAAQLSHPNIVTAYDAEKAGDSHMLVMEFVPGLSLAEAVKKKGPLPVAYACLFARQVALGLQHAHERGLVHRDIKPHNLMLTLKNQIKILDFGLAKVVREEATGTGLTSHNAYMGTPDYSAPEQATDARNADIRADIYSLGCTLYCLLAGRPPFREETALKTVLAHLKKQPQPLTELRPDVPERSWHTVERMLAKEPIRRYQNPKEVALAMAPFLKPDSKGGAALEADIGSPMKGTVIETVSEIAEVVRKAPRPARPKEVPTKMTPSFADRRDDTVSANEVERFADDEMPPRPAWWKHPGVLAGAFGASLALILIFVGIILIAANEGAPDNKQANSTAPKKLKSGPGQHEPPNRKDAPPPEPKPKPEPIRKERDPDPPPDDEAQPVEVMEIKPKEEGPPALKLAPQMLPVTPQKKEDAKSKKGKAKDSPARGDRANAGKYEDYCAAAKAKLLEGFDAAIAELRSANGSAEEKVKWIEKLKKEKELFDKSGMIPWSEPMRPHVDRYLDSLGRAQRNLQAAYEPLIDKANRAGDDEEAARLFSEKKKRLDVKVIAQWRHFVNGIEVSVNKLYSNGIINNSEGFETWNYANGVLVFQWPNPNGPGGVFRDALQVSANGETYAGTNNVVKPERRPRLTGEYVAPLDQPN